MPRVKRIHLCADRKCVKGKEERAVPPPGRVSSRRREGGDDRQFARYPVCCHKARLFVTPIH